MTHTLCRDPGEQVRQGSHKTFNPYLARCGAGGCAAESRPWDLHRQLKELLRISAGALLRGFCRLMCDSFEVPTLRLKEVRTVGESGRDLIHSFLADRAHDAKLATMAKDSI